MKTKITQNQLHHEGHEEHEGILQTFSSAFVAFVFFVVNPCPAKKFPYRGAG
jgi:hypothetical protein